MNYEEAVNAWAERRLNLRKGSVTKVDFGMDTRGYCETCSYDVVGVEVAWKDKSNHTNHDFIDLGYETFADVLAEILEEK